MSEWFDGVRVAGALSEAELEEKLGEPIDMGTVLPTSGTGGRFSFDWLLGTPAWRHTSHAIGYIPVEAAAPTSICHVGDVVPDRSLMDAQVRISLDGLHVANYPGSGTHRVLFTFFVQNRTDSGTEDANFNATYRVHEGDSAAVLNYPIFVGVTPSQSGLVIRCFTVNVKNDNDENFLDLLESETFKTGLRLATIAQPAIAPLSSLAIGMAKVIAERHRNIPVQDVFLGLDFGGTATGARLATGTYVAVQIPKSIARSWRWSDWTYDPRTGQIVDSQGELLPLNYFMIGISRC